jgi:hypothetical protein
VLVGLNELCRRKLIHGESASQEARRVQVWLTLHWDAITNCRIAQRFPAL